MAIRLSSARLTHSIQRLVALWATPYQRLADALSPFNVATETYTMTMSPYRIVGAWFCAAWVALMGVSQSPQGHASTTTPWRQVTPRRAAQLTDFVGVNIRLHNRPSAYQNVEGLVKPRLRELGVKHVRDSMINVGNPDKSLWAKQASLASLGIRFLIVADPRGVSSMPGILASLAKSIAYTWGVQGPNELDVGNNQRVAYRGFTYPNNIRYYQRDLYKAVKESLNSRIKALPVVGPSFMSHHAAEIGSLPCNFGAVHSYAWGNLPSHRLDDVHIPAARIVCPNEQVLATETGYHSAMSAQNPWQPAVLEGVRAGYVPRLYLEYFRRAVFRRVYLYQLIDDEVRPSDQEENFGLVSATGTRKPAFVSLKAMMDTLRDTSSSAATFTPRTLTYRLESSSAIPDDLRTVVVQQADGEYLLFFWRELTSYDKDRRRVVDVPKLSFRLALGKTATGITVQRLVGDTLSSLGSTRSIPLSIDDEPVVVKFRTP
jgi:hypothetical protein